MIQPSADQLDQLIEEVIEGPKYRLITGNLIRWIGEKELIRHKSFKEAVKATRSKLHQIGGSYQEGGIHYSQILTDLRNVAGEIELHNGLQQSMKLADFRPILKSILGNHASTKERIPILDEFYLRILANIAPIQSIVDLACGLNPLTIAWMPLAEDCTYFAIDIYQDMINFLNQAFKIFKINGQAEAMNLLERIPSGHFQIALLLKTLPCLEQLDKTVSLRLLDGIQADYLLVSYPVHSLSGRSKGMLTNYERHFREMISNFSWKIERYEFASELVFLVKK